MCVAIGDKAVHALWISGFEVLEFRYECVSKHLTSRLDKGDRDGGVAETFLNDSRMNGLLQGECRPRVAEAVEREAWETVACHSAEELSAHCVGSEA